MNISKYRYLELKYYCRQKENIELVKKVAEETDPILSKYIIKNVTEGIIYEYMPVPCGRRKFYETRRNFFYNLSKKR